MEDKRHWFAAYTKSRHEKVVKERLEKKGIVTFLPLVRQKSQWKDRIKEVEIPLIKSYIFVQEEARNLLYVLQTEGILNIVRIGEKYTLIPDFQIEALQKALEERIHLEPANYFTEGEKVRVLTGPLSGRIGLITKISGHSKLILKIDAINFAFSTPVDPENVEKFH
ncbi:MAG: UpxY family transcription antiterminator [Candidatus Marinimicrobia bacterium]|nr:UpxY family transcription antiterminator [Candidatus Neomarinimicrobiota bacterium]